MPENASVAIVEDDELLLDVVINVLYRARHSVVAYAGKLDKAESQLKQMSEAPNVYLIDCMFPPSEGRWADPFMGAYFASLVLEKFGDKTRLVKFSSDKKHNFGQFSFPEKNRIKTHGEVEARLGKFVTDLP